MAEVSETPQHPGWDYYLDHNNLGTEIFLNVQIPTTLKAETKPNVHRKLGFGGVKREYGTHGNMLSHNMMGKDSPSPECYHIKQQAIRLDKGPLDTLIEKRNLQKKQEDRCYIISNKTKREKMSRSERDCNKKNVEDELNYLQAPGRNYFAYDYSKDYAHIPSTISGTKFLKTKRLDIVEYLEYQNGKRESPPIDKYFPHTHPSKKLFSAIQYKTEVMDELKQKFKHFRTSVKLKDRNFGVADRFRYKYPVPNDCSQGDPVDKKKKDVKKWKKEKPLMGLAPRDTMIGFYIPGSEHVPPPGSYDVPIPETAHNFNVRQGHRVPLPRGRGANVKRVVEKKNRETGEIIMCLNDDYDPIEEEALKFQLGPFAKVLDTYHGKVANSSARLARRRTVERLEAKRSQQQDMTSLFSKIFIPKGTTYPSLPKKVDLDKVAKESKEKYQRKLVKKQSSAT